MYHRLFIISFSSSTLDVRESSPLAAAHRAFNRCVLYDNPADVSAIIHKISDLFITFGCKRRQSIICGSSSSSSSIQVEGKLHLPESRWIFSRLLLAFYFAGCSVV
jgi:hypothetical protein